MSDPSDTPTKPRIKVTDRRLFDSEGNYRAEADTDTDSEDAPTAPSAETPAANSAAETVTPASEPAVNTEAPAAEPVAEAERPTSDSGAAAAAPKSRWFGRARTTEPSPEPDLTPAAEQQPEPDPPPATVLQPETDLPPAAVQQPEPEAQQTDAAPGTRPATRDLPRDLSGLVESQYFEALLYMGAMPHPATGQVMEDLEMAQYKIDVLGMLQTKTEGNRTPEESKVLEDVLYQLRMLYLQKGKVAKL